MADLTFPTQTNKSLHPIIEPIVDSAAFIGSGILATSYLTTWINDPISNSGVIVSGIFSAASIQLAKKILPNPNNLFLRKMASTIMGLGIPSISLPYLPSSLVGVITQKAAFQIGAINLSVKVVIYVLQYLGSMKLSRGDSDGIIDLNLILSQDPEVIQKYSKDEATSAHANLLKGLVFQTKTYYPDFAAYKAYVTLFQQYDLLINAPKSTQEIPQLHIGTLLLYFAYYENDLQNWMKLPLPTQFQFKQMFEYHGETSDQPHFFLYPSTKAEIDNASKDLITCIHEVAKDNSNYWKELKFQSDLTAAFKKFGLPEVGADFIFSRDLTVIRNYSIDEASIALRKLLAGTDTFLDKDNKPDLTTYNGYFTLFGLNNLPIPAPKSVQEIEKQNFAEALLYFAYYNYDPENWPKLPLPMQFSFRRLFLSHGEIPKASHFLYPSNKEEIDNASKELICTIHQLATHYPNYWDDLQFQPELEAAFKKFRLDETGPLPK